MKKVLFSFENIQKVHTLWKNFIFDPPDGYEYYDLLGNKIIKKESSPKAESDKEAPKYQISSGPFNNLVMKSLRISILNQFSKYFGSIRLSNRVKKLNPDIVYLDNGKFLKTDLPWVVDAENVGVFTINYNYPAIRKSHYRGYIERVLASESCKMILPYSETSKKSILACLNCEKFIHKIKTAQNVVPFKPKIRKIEHNTFNILFTGSFQNYDEFWNRGGREVVLSFLELSKRLSNLKLILRCAIPNIIKQKIRSNKNIEIYENPLPYDEFESLFLKSDVYVFPAYTGYAISILDAMNYELPIITTDFLENGEKVENFYNGFKIPLGKNKPPFILPYIPIHFTDSFKPPLDKLFIKNLSDKIQHLVENESEKVQMGKNSRKMLKENFSLEIKKNLLKKLFEKI